MMNCVSGSSIFNLRTASTPLRPGKLMSTSTTSGLKPGTFPMASSAVACWLMHRKSGARLISCDSPSRVWESSSTMETAIGISECRARCANARGPSGAILKQTSGRSLFGYDELHTCALAWFACDQAVSADNGRPPLEVFQAVTCGTVGEIGWFPTGRIQPKAPAVILNYHVGGSRFQLQAE